MLTEALPQPAEPKHADDTAQLFSQDQLEAYAARLALTHRLAENPRRGRPLLPRLDESAERLDAAYAFLSSVGRDDAQPVASEQWLRDNHHVVQDQVREIRQDLPRRYYLQLPKLADGPFQGYPRDLRARARTDQPHRRQSRFRHDHRFCDRVSARLSQLSIGETWAVPIMLRLALVEELRRLADGVVRRARKPRERPASGTRQRRKRKSGRRGRFETCWRRAGRTTVDCRAAFVVELLQWLRDQPSTAAPAWQALQRALQEQGDSADEMLRMEHQRQAADQLAISATSSRACAAHRVDRLDAVLRARQRGRAGAARRPGGCLRRDGLRHPRSISPLDRAAGEAARASRSQRSLRRAIELARAAIEDEPQHDRQHHVGYYLISRGRFRLERDVGYPPKLRERFARFAFRHPGARIPESDCQLHRGQCRQPPHLCGTPWCVPDGPVAGRGGSSPARQRARGQPDQSARHGAGSAAPVAEARDARRNPRRRPHDRRRSHDRRVRDASGRSLRRSRGAVPRQPRSASTFRAARRLSGCTSKRHVLETTRYSRGPGSASTN